jgi:hypothetical protein
MSDFMRQIKDSYVLEALKSGCSLYDKNYLILYLLKAALVKDKICREGITDWEDITQMYADIQVGCDSEESGPFSANLVETSEILMSLRRLQRKELTNVVTYCREALPELIPYLLYKGVPQEEKEIVMATFRKGLKPVYKKEEEKRIWTLE